MVNNVIGKKYYNSIRDNLILINRIKLKLMQNRSRYCLIKITTHDFKMTTEKDSFAIQMLRKTNVLN